MGGEDFFRALKGESPELLAKLEALCQELKLTKLYLVYIDAEEVAWGVRGLENILDEEGLKNRLMNFVRESIGEEMMPVHCLLLGSDINEVMYVATRAIQASSVQYAGALEILAVDEEKGETLLTVELSFQKGVKNALMHLLPWMNKVEFSDEENLIIITDEAARQIREILKDKNIPVSGGMRFRLMPGGCSGMMYDIRPEPQPQESDEVIEKTVQDESGTYIVRVFIPAASLRFMRGSVIDYGYDEQQHNFTKTFLIKNPNQKGSCGCGQSPQF